MKASFAIIYILVIFHVYDVSSYKLYEMVKHSKIKYDYDPDPANKLGVRNWHLTYKKDCGGSHQSPINIETAKIRYGVYSQCPRMIHIKGSIQSAGYTDRRLKHESPVSYMLTNVPYRTGFYYLQGLHLHWGGVKSHTFELNENVFQGSGILYPGSEHTLDGHRFTGELHFVFYNGKYRDFKEAAHKSDGVVVICIFIETSKTYAKNTKASRFSEFLHRSIPKTFPYQLNPMTDMDMSMFFDGNCEFYTYSGSLTTPHCHETVRWLLPRQPLLVTERLWFDLTALVTHGDPNARWGNYRPTQPLNDRVVEANFMRPVLLMPNGGVWMLIGNMTSFNTPRMGSTYTLVPG